MHRVTKGRVGSSRSRPVSCHFCRSRKLKCSRQFPCDNCTSRAIACHLYPAESRPSSIQDRFDGPSNSLNADLVARIRRLEEIVIGNGSAPVPLSRAENQTSSLPFPSQKEQQPQASPEEQSFVATVDWLEGEITSRSTNMPLGYEMEFKTCTIGNAASTTSENCQNDSTKRCIWLPLYEESQMVVKKYTTDITYLHHVVHIPSVHAVVDELYFDIRENKPIKIRHVSLLLGIFASTTLSWTERDMKYSIFSSVKEANDQSTHWMKVAFEVLEYSRQTHSESIEDIQSMIILLFVVCNIVGITSQARYLVSTAISVAKELCLHRIDCPHNSSLDVPSPTSVRAEIGRRVWWYLVGTDWQLSQISGPHKGTYTIDPRHMMTNKPLNANDEDLVDGMVGIGQPSTQATSMSYCLQRIRLGELCREMADSTPFTTAQLGTVDYDQTKDIDRKLSEVVHGLPAFFSLTHNIGNLPTPDSSNSNGIIIQRYVINSLLYTQRCRLHLPYLARASKDSTYAYSRAACLEAARMVIRTERQLSMEKISFALARLKFSGMTQCVCMAIMVLLIDFCLSWKLEQADEGGRRREIYEAFGMLEEAREQSPFAAKLLESFKSVLNRHKLPSMDIEGAVAGSGDPEQDASRGFSTGDASSTNMTNRDAENTLVVPSLPFSDDLWQAFDDSMDSTSIDWKALFSDLDTPFMSM